MWRLWLALGAAGLVVAGLAVWRIDANAYERGATAERAVWQEASRKAATDRNVERQEAQRRIAAKDAFLAAEEASHQHIEEGLNNDLAKALAGAGKLPAIPDGVLAPLRRQSR